MADKNIYQQKMFIYEQRKKERKAKLIKMYGRWKGGCGVPEHETATIKRLTIKINNWRKMERIIEERRIKVIALANHIAYFSGFSIKGSAMSRLPIANTMRGIFCKWGIENGIRGIILAEYIGYNNRYWASKTRLTFTRSFTKNKQNKELWERFKLYYQDQLEKNIEENLEK